MTENNEEVTIRIESDLWDADDLKRFAEIAQTSDCFDGTSIGEALKAYGKTKEAGLNETPAE